MKLFLSSLSISATTLSAFEALAGKKASAITMALCENAADVYAESSKGFVYSTRQDLEQLGVQITRFDLRDYVGKTDELVSFLKQFDVVWFGGGNTYYLRYLMKESGFDMIINNLLTSGLVYGGGSAGAVVATTDLHYFDTVDDPALSPEAIYKGLCLTSIALVPHWGTLDIKKVLTEIRDNFVRDGKQVICITDEQSCVIHGDSVSVVG